MGAGAAIPYEAMARSSVGDTSDTIKSIYGLWHLLFPKHKEPDRPTYEIPSEIGQYLSVAEARARQRYLPGYDEILGNIGAATSSAIGEQREMGRYDIGNIFEKQLSSLRNLGTSTAQYRLTNEERLKQALELVSQYKDKAWSWNVSGRYWDEKMDFLAERQSGLSNFFGGLEGIAEREPVTSGIGGMGGGMPGGAGGGGGGG